MEFVEKEQAATARWEVRGHMVVVDDAVTLSNFPVSHRRIRYRKGKDAVPVNHSKQSIHMMWVLRDGALEL